MGFSVDDTKILNEGVFSWAVLEITSPLVIGSVVLILFSFELDVIGGRLAK